MAGFWKLSRKFREVLECGSHLRFFIAAPNMQSARGLAQSKTLRAVRLCQAVLAATLFLNSP
jgi:hypothetical protein